MVQKYNFSNFIVCLNRKTKQQMLQINRYTKQASVVSSEHTRMYDLL